MTKIISDSFGGVIVVCTSLYYIIFVSLSTIIKTES